MDMLFIGDSLIEYGDWDELLPDDRVTNLGISGETVESLLSRTEDICHRFSSPDIILIMSGINNVAMEDNDFIGAYTDILRKLGQTYNNSRIYVNSLLPVFVPFISNSTVSGINDRLRKMAAGNGAEYLDIYRVFVDDQGAPVKGYLSDDGVHLSIRGYEVWTAELARYFRMM